MKALVLGASGHIGKRLVEILNASENIETICASRGRLKINGNQRYIVLDTRDEQALIGALQEVDVVINCVAGDAESISNGAKALVNAALVSGLPRIVHLSTMVVYGGYEGKATEETPFDANFSWYAKAKCQAETEINRYVEQGGKAVVLRPGCVSGPDSQLWVERIGKWLQAGRLGDLGNNGNGWSNLVHVDDVCAAIVASIHKPMQAGEVARFNLAAPDSPRWNQFFNDLSVAIKATPVKTISKYQLYTDIYIARIVLKVLEKLLNKIGVKSSFIPQALSPAQLKFFSQTIHLECKSAEQYLNIQFRPYKEDLADSAKWFLENFKIN